jgi:formylmethanofuran dehydrogenase subunit E
MDNNKKEIKKKVKCDKCGVIVFKSYLKNHQSRMICKKFWDYSLLDTDDEE